MTPASIPALHGEGTPGCHTTVEFTVAAFAAFVKCAGRPRIHSHCFVTTSLRTGRLCALPLRVSIVQRYASNRRTKPLTRATSTSVSFCSHRLVQFTHGDYKFGCMQPHKCYTGDVKKFLKKNIITNYSPCKAIINALLNM